MVGAKGMSLPFPFNFFEIILIDQYFMVFWVFILTIVIVVLAIVIIALLVWFIRNTEMPVEPSDKKETPDR
jgi:hypothetical protein